MGRWPGHQKKDRTRPKMNSEQIARDIERTLLRYRAGLITIQEARQQLSLLLAALKAREQAVLEEKIDRLEAILEARR